ncbi:hypothetical protein LguiA_034111 [Lonicera macranthoides]
MANLPTGGGRPRKVFNRGAWTAEEDIILAGYIEVHGAKKWRTVATKSGTHRYNLCRYIFLYGAKYFCQS